MAAKVYSTKSNRVNVVFSDEIKHLAYANSDGVAWQGSQPMFTFYTTCYAKDGAKRESGYTADGGRIGLESFSKNRKAADIGKEAARLAVVNLAAQEVRDGGCVAWRTWLLDRKR